MMWKITMTDNYVILYPAPGLVRIIAARPHHVEELYLASRRGLLQ